MSFDPQRLRDYRFAPVHQHLTQRDLMLYALGVGFGADPLDAGQLRYVYEDGLRAVPTMAITLGYPNTLREFAAATGIRAEMVLHVSQNFTLHRPLPLQGDLVGQTVVTGIYDKGPGRGMLWTYRNRVSDAATGEVICDLDGASMARGHGGFGGDKGVPPASGQAPDRPADIVCDIATLPQAALLYRLSGDFNPVHGNPVVARQAGFDAPILHGRCTFGVAGHAILRHCCGYDATRMTAMSAQFTSPVYPGETVRTEIWSGGSVPGQVHFRASVPARGVTVLSRGTATIG